MFVSEPVYDSFDKVDEYVHCVSFHRITLLLIRGTFKDTKCIKHNFSKFTQLVHDVV